MAYIYLAVAIVAEVAATSALKASEEFTRLWTRSLSENREPTAGKSLWPISPLILVKHE